MKTILIAAVELKGGKGKDGESVKIAPGTQITDAVRKQLGIDAEDVRGLRERGFIAEVPVHADADAADGSVEIAELKKQLAAETKRANEAEAEIAKLKKSTAAA